jgi:aspartate aminotransferase
VIDLGAGEPDFPTPACVIDAAHRALDAGSTRYTQVEGIAPLRQIIAERATALRGVAVDPADVVVSTGTKQALFNACFSLFAAGDEVLVPTPGWTSYYQMLALSRATAIAVVGSPDRQLKVTPDDLIRAATPRTRGIVLNSPCNPTGAVYSRNELASIVAVAAERGWWILSDEIYRAISYDEPAASLLAVAGDFPRLIVVDGLAKTFAMTGWRIGWSIAPRALSASMTALQSHTTSNATTLSQHAAIAALTMPEAQEASRSMVKEFRRRRDQALAELRANGVEVLEPKGAFYLFAHVGTVTGADPDPGGRFAHRLLEEFNVAVVPGGAFGAPEWVRLSYAAPIDDVLEGVRRLVRARIS